ncbi:unnamed protein product [Effrenium voratum]|nr:unnamed protein product [Effrenium voratum]
MSGGNLVGMAAAEAGKRKTGAHHRSRNGEILGLWAQVARSGHSLGKRQQVFWASAGPILPGSLVENTRHNSLDRLKESLQLDAPMTVQSQVNGLSPVLGELTEETKMNVAQFWQTQSRDSDSLFSDNYKLGPNQWVDETYFGDTFKAYPFSRGFDDAYYPARAPKHRPVALDLR